MQSKSGKKYLKNVKLLDGKIDVYSVLDAFDVRCPASQHAIKKLLMPGARGDKDALTDLKEARDAIDRAIQFTEQPRAVRREDLLGEHVLKKNERETMGIIRGYDGENYLVDWFNSIHYSLEKREDFKLLNE